MKNLGALLVLAAQDCLATSLTVGQSGNLKVQGPDVLTAAGINAGDYGCWCRRIGGNDFHGGKVISSVDLLCKQWNAARRCLSLVGGTCEYEADNTYACTDVTDAGTCSATNNCGLDSCKIDVYYADLVKQEITNSGIDTSVVSDAVACAQASNVANTPNVCTGAAPLVTPEYQEGTQVCDGQGLVPGPFPMEQINYPNAIAMQSPIKNKHMANVVMSDEFAFEFDYIMPDNSKRNAWRNILHVGSSKNTQLPRIIEDKGRQRFTVVVGCKSSGLNYVHVEESFPLNVQMTVRVEVRKKCSNHDRLITKVYVDDVLKATKEGNRCPGMDGVQNAVWRAHDSSPGSTSLYNNYDTVGPGTGITGNMKYQNLSGTPHS